jgi:rhodanese-related sulfurtransferase
MYALQKSLNLDKFTADSDTIIVTACGKGGGRSESGANYLRSAFPNQAYFLEGGTFGWLENE